MNVSQHNTQLVHDYLTCVVVFVKKYICITLNGMKVIAHNVTRVVL